MLRGQENNRLCPILYLLVKRISLIPLVVRYDGSVVASPVLG